MKRSLNVIGMAAGINASFHKNAAKISKEENNGRYGRKGFL
jgi:hypothetical protein